MEAALKDAELFRAILDALADPVFVKDREHRWLYGNPAFCDFVGLSFDEIVGHTDADYLQPEVYEVFYEMDDEVFRTGRENLNEETFIGVKGEPRIVSTKKTLMNGLDGEALLVGIVRDITELRRAENEVLERRRAEIEAEEASLAKSRFLANMSHELRTPLNGIRGYTELLQEELDDPEHQAILDRVLTASNHLLSMIDQVLDLSRIEAGRIELRPEPIEITALLDQVASTLRPAADAVGSRIELACPEAVEVIADRRSVFQIVLNLAENALKYASPGTVRISCRSIEGAMRIRVADDGPGIPADQQAHLFEKFWRADPSAKVTGSGLGLAIVREMTVHLGGTLTVESTPGQGATFVVTLPVQRLSAPG